jgi:cyanophycinase
LAIVTASLALEHPYRYFRLGNSRDAQATPRGGFALIGGGKDLDAAFQWMCRRSGGGDFLILRATGTDAYNPYVAQICRVNSIATLVIPNRPAANDPAVAKRIAEASAIFFSGGDQANYINFWKGTPVQTSVNAAIGRGVPVGGTSAGLAIQGQFIYSAQNDAPDGPDLTSKMSLANPYNLQVIIAAGFLKDPALRNVITETHFVTRDRMGRLLTFMARILTDGKANTIHAIGIDEHTAVLLDPDGTAAVRGSSRAYFLSATVKPSLCRPGVPLSFSNIAVQRLTAGDTFNVKSWTRTGGSSYTLNVDSGIVHSTQSNGMIY